MTKNKTQHIQGFTLVELLIVLAISAVVLAGVLQVFNTSNKSYSVQEEVAAVQQNLRIAKLFLARDVRMAGAGLKGMVHTLSDGTKATVYGLLFENANGATGTDKLTIRYVDYSETSCDGLLPQLTLSGTMPANSSVAGVTENLNASPYDVWKDSFICGSTEYGKKPPFVDFKAIITSPDGTQSDVVYITQAPSTNLQNNPYPTGCGATCNKTLNSFPAGSTINFFNETKLREVVYLVEDNVLKRSEGPFDGGQTLNPLAENIEDLQFRFGLDTDADGVEETWVWNADLTDTQKPQVRSVRISILGRTSNRHQRGSQVYTLEDHAAGGQDGYPRRLLQTTVKVRNLAL